MLVSQKRRPKLRLDSSIDPEFFLDLYMQECLRILGQNYETLATVQRNIGSFNDVHIIIAEKIYRRV